MLRRLIILCFALILAAPVSAQAEGFGRGGGWGHGGGRGGPPMGGFRGPEMGFRGGDGGRGGWDYGREGGPPPGYGRAGPMMREPAPGWGEPGPGSGNWRRGESLPPESRGAVVQDFGRYHLRRPPRGYYWYRAGDNFVLTSHAGEIFEVTPGDGY